MADHVPSAEQQEKNFPPPLRPHQLLRNVVVLASVQKWWPLDGGPAPHSPTPNQTPPLSGYRPSQGPAQAALTLDQSAHPRS
jgi:hypothetical protein